MKAFLLTFLVLAALSVIGRAIWLARGEFPRRTPRETAMDLIFDVAMICWAVFLLASEVAHG